MKHIQHIAIIGSGRAAQYFSSLFYTHGYRVDIISRNSRAGMQLAEQVGGSFSGEITLGSEADMVLLCVNDDQVANVVAQLPLRENQVVCHCAGAIELSALHRYAQHGVIYPLQSLGPELGNTEVPFLLEANNPGVKEQLEHLLSTCKKQFQYVDSAQRRAYHLAAVFANNFTNAMLMATDDLSDRLKLDFNLLKPLIAQTFSRIESHRPSEVQTGPAARNDRETMARHLELLSAYPELRELYQSISRYITDRKAEK